MTTEEFNAAIKKRNELGSAIQSATNELQDLHIDAGIALSRERAECDKLRTALAAEQARVEAIPGDWHFKRLYDEEVKIVDGVWKALGITAYSETDGKNIYQHVAELKARVETQIAKIKELQQRLNAAVARCDRQEKELTEVNAVKREYQGQVETLQNSLANLTEQNAKPRSELAAKGEPGEWHTNKEFPRVGSKVEFVSLADDDTLRQGVFDTEGIYKTPDACFRTRHSGYWYINNVARWRYAVAPAVAPAPASEGKADETVEQRWIAIEDLEPDESNQRYPKKLSTYLAEQEGHSCIPCRVIYTPPPDPAPVPEPIPEGVWWDGLNFHEPLREYECGSSVCRTSFHDKWYPRRSEFPTQPPEREKPWSPDMKACHELAECYPDSDLKQMTLWLLDHIEKLESQLAKPVAAGEASP